LGKSFVGRYINLDRSIDRRAALEQRLGAAGCADRYSRFAGIDGSAAPRGASPLSPGALGCFLSHAEVILEHAENQPDQHLHILEDDAVLSARTVPILDQIIESPMAAYDILFTDISINFNLILQLSAMKTWRASGMADAPADGGPRTPHSVLYLDLNGQLFGAASSYLVSRRALPRLAAILRAEIAAGPRLPIDMFYVELLNTDVLRGACAMPFLTSIRPPDECETTINDGMSDMDTISYLSRAPFSIDRDDAAIERLTAALEQNATGDTLTESMLRTTRYLFSRGFSLR
jgi:GR25 family glycosyltransferase involved in LPS biosynthesis